MFPTDLIQVPEDLREMLLEPSLAKRDRLALKECVDSGYIREEDVDSLSEMQYLIWQGMHTMFLNNRCNYSVEEATEITMNHIRHTMTS
jgi:hypothetical protein